MVRDGGLHSHTQGQAYVRGLINMVEVGELQNAAGQESGGLTHLCTAAWKRCRRAVQSLPPLKPTQSWRRLY